MHDCKFYLIFSIFAGMHTSLIPLLPPLIKIFPKKENAEKKKRKCGKVIFYVLKLS
jgi:hypothetical protein